MNSLSWLLLSADIAGNIKGTLTFCIAMGCLVLGGLGVMKCVVEENFSAGWPIAKIGMWLFIPALILVTLMPSKNTIYMIAASEMGETVINTPETRKLFNLLKSKVEEQLAPVVKNQ